MTESAKAPLPPPERPAPIAAVAIAFLVALLLYALGAAPGALYGDSGEFQSVALVGGIPHPSGYPTYIMVGRLFALLPFPEPAYRITFMSVFFGAVSVSLMVLLLARLGASTTAALAGAAVYATGFTFWLGSLRAEVYTLAVALGLLSLLRALAALRRGAFRDHLIAGLLLGLTLSGHLFFAPLALVVGLALAWNLLRQGGAVVSRLAALLAVFLLGLTPFLYLFWADGQPFEMNYFDQVRKVVAPLGGSIPGFETTPERVQWLLTARNNYPAVPFVLVKRALAAALAYSAVILLLFEFGPLGGPVALAGLWRQWREERRVALILALAGGISLVFAAALTYGGSLLFVFLIPSALVLAIWIGLGIDVLLRRLGSGGPRAATAAAFAIAVAVTAQAVRLRSQDHPIAGRYAVVQEDGRPMREVIPSLRHWDEPQRFGRRMVEILPESSFVVASWQEMAVMYYVTRALRERRDVTLWPWGPHVLDGVAAWQERHDVARRPVVFLSSHPVWRRHAAAIDSIPAVEGRSIYVARTPLAVEVPRVARPGTTIERPSR